MHNHTLLFIQDLAIIMLIAGLTTVLCHRLKQPIVFGYLIAGIIIGPHTPPFSLISEQMTVRTLAELGVIFLMFSLGLEFNIHKLIKVGISATIAAVFEIVLMIWLGYGIGYMFGWSQMDSIFLGAILSISSTTIIVKALGELGMKNEGFAQLIFGILIIEDIFAILILALLSSDAVTGAVKWNEVVITATKLSSFLVISLLAGILLIPRLLSYIAKSKNDEMFLISILGLCFGFSLLVVKMGYSVALGAFIIGAIIAEAKELKKIEVLINPIRDMFSAIFFVSVGLLFDFRVLGDYLIPILVITIAVIIGKVVSSSLGVLVTGRDGKTAVRVGMGLAQIGEFSFIIAGVGIALKLTGDFLYSIAVGVSIITTLTTPYLIKYSDIFTKQLSVLIPGDLSSTFKLYATWLQNIQPDEDQIRLQESIKRSIYQIIINLFIVIAIFFGGSYLAETYLGHLLIRITNIYLQKTILWASALLISLPFLIATYRKIKALSMILAELGVKESVNSQLNISIRKIIAQIIPITSIFGIMIFVSLLSASILPPIELLFFILVFAILLIVIMLPWFIKFHSRLQARLLDSLKNEKKPDKR